jgi:hypothetical protein
MLLGANAGESSKLMSIQRQRKFSLMRSKLIITVFGKIISMISMQNERETYTLEKEKKKLKTESMQKY